MYCDDSLVYNKSIYDHANHLRYVYNLLRKENLFANFEKYSFCEHEVVFLGFVVISLGIEVDESKIDAK